MTFLVMLAIYDFHNRVFSNTTKRLTTSSEKGITSSPIETPGKFKAFVCLTAWLDPKVIALVMLTFNLRQIVFGYVEICSDPVSIAAGLS